MNYATRTRLTAKARAEGMALYQSARSGDYYASSTSEPGRNHHVSASWCDCQGHARYGYCKHRAALLTAIADAPACEWCEGTGRVSHDHSRWVGGSTNGYRQQWTSTTRCEHCAGCGEDRTRERQAA